MKQTKYIPGDLVNWWATGKPMRLDGVYYKKKKDKVYYTREEENNNTIYYSDEGIEPIPLTPSILEKNGWEKRTKVCCDGEHLEDFSSPSFPLEHFTIAFTKEGIKATYDCLLVREVKYVSDLQHLLFGLGLNSEMEV